MTSTDLVRSDGALVGAEDRQRALAQLNEAAETANTPYAAREIMIKGRTLAQLLEQAKAPFDDARLAGKASTVAARRLGRMLGDLPGERRFRGFGQPLPSERSELVRELGLSLTSKRNLIQLTRISDPDFQRYIQRTDIVPSMTGALMTCHGFTSSLSLGSKRRTTNRTSAGWRKQRRLRAGVTKPTHPSFDEGYSLLVRSIGHLSNAGAADKKKTATTAAIELLYQAEDLLRPFLGGYAD